jgi:L-rhamnose mutarotase
MKHLTVLRTTLFSPFLFLLLLSHPSQSQNSHSVHKEFFLVEYIKINPGKTSEYLKNETTVWKSLYQERMKQGRILSWALYQVAYPSGSQEPYDFVAVQTVKDWAAIEHVSAGTEEIAKKLFNKDQLAAYEKTDLIRSRVKQEIWCREDAVIKTNAKVPPSKYQLANFMQVANGKWEEYMSMEKTLVKPIHEEHTKIGGRAGWALFVLHQPSGAGIPYQAATIDYYDRWDHMGNPDESSFWEQIHPGKSPEYIERQITSTRVLLRQELRILVDFIQ